MKKAFFALLAMALLLTSFTTAVKPFSSKAQSVAFLEKTASALSYNFQDTWDFTGAVAYNPCGTGEDIVLSGVAHINIHGVYNTSTNKSTDYFHGNFQGITGVGATSGTVYHTQDVLNEKTGYNYDGCTLTVNDVESITFVAAGSQSNVVAKYQFTYTYNFCTGEFTVLRDKISQSCH